MNIKPYHITTAIHDSRTSSRMIRFKVRERRELGTNPYPNIIYFTSAEELLVTETISQIVKEDNLKLLAFNICRDHIHLLFVCDIEDISKIMQKIKAVTSKILNRVLKTAREYTSLSKPKPIWQQKYSSLKEITSEEQLQNTIKYIQTNRRKHQLEAHNEALQDIIDKMIYNIKDVFRQGN